MFRVQTIHDFADGIESMDDQPVVSEHIPARVLAALHTHVNHDHGLSGEAELQPPLRETHAAVVAKIHLPGVERRYSIKARAAYCAGDDVRPLNAIRAFHDAGGFPRPRRCPEPRLRACGTAVSAANAGRA